MLVDARQDDLGAIDIYPHANTEQEILLQPRLTVMYGRIYYRGNLWTAEMIQREKGRVLRLEAAFKVAQRIVECER